MPRYKAIISYEGTHFAGWQKQTKERTVQETLEKVLSQITQQKVLVVGAGRTDAGVHALHQVAHFDLPDLIDTAKLLKGVNGLLENDVQLLHLDKTTDDFHARFSVKSKIYCYHLHLAQTLSPLQRHTCLHMNYRLSLARFLEATNYLVGTHDFTSFANKRGSSLGSMVRTIDAISVIPVEGGIKIYFLGKSFLYKMIRNLMGLLVDVSRGAMAIDEIPTIFSAKNREKGPNALPGKGLTLVNIDY